jgi:hypothetical protein
MATTTYKVLGQASPAATTETGLYTVPASTQTVISSLIVANRGTASSTFRVSISVTGAATANKDYIFFDTNILPKTTATFTLGITVAATDVIRVYSSSTDLSFNLFGSELA